MKLACLKINEKDWKENKWELLQNPKWRCWVERGKMTSCNTNRKRESELPVKVETWRATTCPDGRSFFPSKLHWALLGTVLRPWTDRAEWSGELNYDICYFYIILVIIYKSTTSLLLTSLSDVVNSPLHFIFLRNVSSSAVEEKGSLDHWKAVKMQELLETSIT